jgi:transglutaminase-like putative cysteine protease
MLKKGISAIFLLVAIVLVSPGARAGVPDWLHAAAQQPAKHYADDVNAVVLLDDQETTIRDTGEIVTLRRIAYRILRPEGKTVAGFGLGFDAETKINYLRGWSITVKGQEYEAKDKDAFERSATTYEVYSDVKERILIVPGADVGTVVGFEYEHKGRPYIFQDQWSFQREYPIEHTRYELRLPPGWEYRADWIHHSANEPVERNGAYTWELSDIPRIETEYHRQTEDALAGSMVVTFFSEKIKNQTYKSWKDFGFWYNQLAAGTREPTAALQQKVVELAPASMSPLERIKTLARFAQRDIRYAEIQIGIGGYRPHSAGDTFSHRYGDCKDKATMLGAMLSQIGVKSYSVLVRTDRGVYTENTPPSSQFNHMIIAIQLPEASSSQPMPGVYEHPKLGRLLIFDPTNDLVPFGQMPFYEQDNYGLLITEQGGEMIHLPISKPESNRVTRTAKLTLLPDGTLKGDVEEVRTGTEAYKARSRYSHQTESDRKKALEQSLGGSMTALHLDSMDAQNVDNIEGDLVLHYQFTAEHYAKNAGPLLLVRPRVTGEKMGALDSTKPRRYAYQFDSPALETDSFEISLPEGYKVDELPDPAKTSLSFGEYNSKITNAGNVLKYTREYKITSPLIPAERIGELNRFFREINMDEKSIAVLKRAN